ncbi:guanine nucleotide exchange protein for ADP-robosylation factor [Massospora cicadina]|nr:guanine nucleotide exchange protein for ADP-robosylation factor [Massospora cicadina]
MEILSSVINRLHNDAVIRKETKLASLTNLAIQDLEKVKVRRVGDISLPPPPSELVEDEVEVDMLRVQDTLINEYIGDRYYSCYKLGCQPWMPPKIQQSSLDAVQKLTAHGLLNGEESWEFPKLDLSQETVVSIDSALAAGTSPFDAGFSCSEANSLDPFDRLWRLGPAEPVPPGRTHCGSHTEYRLIDDLVRTICACYTGPRTDEGFNCNIKIHSVTLLKMVQTLINMTVYALKPVLQTTPKAILTQVVNLVVSRMEECNQKLNSVSNLERKADEEARETTAEDHPKVEAECEQPANGRSHIRPVKASKNYSVLERLLKEKERLEEDSLLVLYLLCHLSLGSELPLDADRDATVVADSRCRAISLELILSMLNNSGRLFQSDPRFNHLIKHNLCLAISRNGISADPGVFELSLSIFIVLFSSFRALLKAEIEVFFKEVYLRILNMQTSTYYQKSLIMQALMKVCSNPQALVDMYVNYDCHLKASSIFENTLDLLSKIAQGRQSKTQSGHRKASLAFSEPPGVDVAEEKWLKLRGLRCLITVVDSLVAWSRGASRAATPREPVASPIPGELDGVPVVVNKNHLEHAGAVGPSCPFKSGEPFEKADAPDRLQQTSSQKQLWKACVSNFNRSPSKGLAEFQKHGFVAPDATSVAAFLLSSQDLNKEAIGIYLGQPEPECIRVMHAFVDQFDFAGIAFVSALRTFLQAFRLPREAQKIDRILEKFADRYCETNPKQFECADTAYVLAFSIMMLNTDQHSPQVRERMNLPMFIKNNKGINNGKDIPDSVLAAIFEDISRTEIVMEEEHLGDVAGPADRRTRYRQETAILQKRLVSLFQGSRAVPGAGLFLSATHADHVKPMFAVAWYPLIAALSQIFEEAHDAGDGEAVQLCLEGFSGAIRISSLYGLEIERNAFLSSLVKFTSLNMIDGLQPKHVGCIQTLVGLAGSLGEFFDDSWELVLEALSRMEQLQLFSDQSSPTGRTPAFQDLAALAHLRAQPILGERLLELRGQGSQVAVDKIFNSSINFSGASIVHFYRALCNVSLQEVDEPEARTYCLHKIVEITYYNMRRIRLEWTPIWKVLRPYFNVVGCHPNHAVAALAVDSLRQLSMQFFERDELSQYHTQHEFLKPFEHIARCSSSASMQDLVLQSLSQMISARAPHIRSGWRSVFTVLAHLAARRPTSLSVLAAAFRLARHIFAAHFDLLGAAFVDGVNGLAAFCSNGSSQEIACEAVELLQAAADPFLAQDVEPAADDQLFLKWFPVLSGLSRVVIECHFDQVREAALTWLFDTLHRSGNLYSQDFWGSVLRSVLMPIFDDVRGYAGKPHAIETWSRAMTLVVGLFEAFYASLAPNHEFVQNLFELLAAMLAPHRNERLTRHGLHLFRTFIIGNAARFDLVMWQSTTACLDSFFHTTTPVTLFALVPEAPGEDASSNGPAVPPKEIEVPSELFKCSLHLSLLHAINEILETPDLNLASLMPSEIYDRWLQLIRQSARFAHDFNRHTALRQFLWKSGHVSQLPHLIRQETSAFSIYLRLAFDSYAVYGDPSCPADLIPECMLLLTRFSALVKSTPLNPKEVGNWAHLVVQLLAQVTDIPFDSPKTSREGFPVTYNLLAASLPDFYSHAVDLITSERLDIRQAAQTFLRWIGKRLFPALPPSPP